MKVILKPHEIWSKFNLPIGTVIEIEGDMNTGSEGEDVVFVEDLMPEYGERYWHIAPGGIYFLRWKMTLQIEQ